MSGSYFLEKIMDTQAFLLKHEFKKAKKYRPEKLKFPVIIEEKIDGMQLRLMQKFACSRRINCLGYYDNLFKKLPSEIQNLASHIPVDGELYWPGHSASSISTALATDPTGLKFKGFHIPIFEGYPHEHLDKIAELGISIPRVFLGYCESKEELYCKPPGEDCLEFHAREWEVEGWILKERIRIVRWWKFKLEETYDLVVTGHNISTAGRHKGKLKSLRCSAWVGGNFIEVANVSGMTDAQRYHFKPENDYGRVCEVKCQEIASKGRLRHPRFICWRNDKNAKECII